MDNTEMLDQIRYLKKELEQRKEAHDRIQDFLEKNNEDAVAFNQYRSAMQALNALYIEAGKNVMDKKL